MSEDQTYRVVTKYDVDASGGDDAIAKLSSGLDALGKQIKLAGEASQNTVESFRDGWKQVVEGIDHAINLAERFAHILGEVAGKIVEVSARAETSRVTNAGLIQAAGFGGLGQGPDAFKQATTIADALNADIRRRAPNFRGTEQDLRGIVQSILAPGAHAGMSLGGIEDLAFKAGSVGGAMGIDAGTIQHELAAMLSGHARGMMPLFQKIGQFMPGGEQGFNQLSPEKRVEALTSALAHFNDMLAAQADTWGAISTTTESYGSEVLRTFSSPIFDEFKSILKEINAWYEAHRQEVNDLAQKIGEGLAGAIHTAWDWTKKIGAALAEVNWSDVGDAIKFIAEAVALYKVQAIAASVATYAWEGAQIALDIAMMANPIGIVLAGVAALVIAITTLVAYIKEARLALLQFLDTGAGSGAFKAIASVTGNPAFEQIAKLSENKGALHYEMGKLAAEIKDQEARGRDGFIGHIKELFDPGGGTRAGAKGSAMKGVDDAIAAMRDLKGTKSTATVNQTNYLTLNQEINQADNPDRVYVDTHKAIRDALLFPKESALSDGGALR